MIFFYISETEHGSCAIKIKVNDKGKIPISGLLFNMDNPGGKLYNIVDSAAMLIGNDSDFDTVDEATFDEFIKRFQ